MKEEKERLEGCRRVIASQIEKETRSYQRAKLRETLKKIDEKLTKFNTLSY